MLGLQHHYAITKRLDKFSLGQAGVCLWTLYKTKLY
jgi:hypothetical protein